MEKGQVTFSFESGRSSNSSRSTPRNNHMVMNDDRDDDDEEVEECDIDMPQSITSFDSNFKYERSSPENLIGDFANYFVKLFRRVEPAKKENFIVIPATAAATDETRPMLLRNRPEGISEIADEKEKYLFDVASRSNDNTSDNYNKVDVFKFGEGILRGLGWTPGSAVGKSNAGYVLILIPCSYYLFLLFVLITCLFLLLVLITCSYYLFRFCLIPYLFSYSSHSSFLFLFKDPFFYSLYFLIIIIIIIIIIIELISFSYP
jgi:hypothetical protein